MFSAAIPRENNIIQNTNTQDGNILNLLHWSQLWIERLSIFMKKLSLD